MAGQTNSWMGKIQISPVPCIGDTVRKTSSTNQDLYSDGGAGYITNANGEPVQTASLWWLIVAGLAIGLIYKSNKRQRQS